MFRYCINLLYLSMAYCSKFTNKGLSYLANGKGCNKVVHLDLTGCEQVNWKGGAVFWICCHASQRVMSRYYKEMVTVFRVVSFDIKIELSRITLSRITTRQLSPVIFFPFISMLVYWFFCKCSCLLFYSLPIVVMSSLNLTHRLGSLSYRARKRENVFPVENCYHFNRNWLDSHRTPNVLPPYLGLVRWPSYVATPLFFVLLPDYRRRL